MDVFLTISADLWHLPRKIKPYQFPEKMPKTDCIDIVSTLDELNTVQTIGSSIVGVS